MQNTLSLLRRCGCISIGSARSSGEMVQGSPAPVRSVRVGLSRATISAGLQELATGPEDDDAAGRLRGPGAGRKGVGEPNPTTWATAPCSSASCRHLRTGGSQRRNTRCLSPAPSSAARPLPLRYAVDPSCSTGVQSTCRPPVDLAEPGAPVAVRVHPRVLFPEQLQRDAVALELAVDMRTVGPNPVAQRRGAGVQPGLERGIVEFDRQRPAQAVPSRPLQIQGDRARADRADLGYRPV